MRISGHLVAALCAIAGFSAQPIAAQEIQKMVGRSELQAVGTVSRIEVLTRAGSGLADYFCAAGEFARTKLNAVNSDRIVVTGVRERSQYRAHRLAVSFILNGPETGQRDFVLLGGPRVGQNSSVGHANFLCEKSRSVIVLDD